MTSNCFDQALTLYDPTTASEVISPESLAQMNFPQITFDVFMTFPHVRILKFGIGHATFGDFARGMGSTWRHLLEAGTASVKGYNTVANELKNAGVAYSKPKIYGGVAAAKATIAEYTLVQEFNSTCIPVLGNHVEGMSHAHNELSDILIAHLKRQVSDIAHLKQQVVELSAKLAQAEQTNCDLRNTNGQLDAKLNCYIQEADSNRMAMVAFHKVKSDPYETIRADLKRENEHLKQENAKVVELDKNLALTKQAAEHQGQLAEVTHDKSLLVKEMQLTKEFEQLLQSKLFEQKEKYSAKIRKIKAERKFYRNKCMELMKPITNDRDEFFTAI